MKLEYLGSWQALTADQKPVPILCCLKYVNKLANEVNAKYCEASFLMDIRVQEAELSHRGNTLVLGIYGKKEALAKMLF